MCGQKERAGKKEWEKTKEGKTNKEQDKQGKRQTRQTRQTMNKGEGEDAGLCVSV